MGGELDRQRRARVIAAAALTSLMVALSYKLYTDHRVASPGDGATTGDDESNDNGTSRSRVGRGPPSESWTTHFTHLSDTNPPGVWGPPTATIDWCEENYAVTIYVAEWWNTISNLAIVGAGGWGLHWTLRHRHEKRFPVLAAFLVMPVMILQNTFSDRTHCIAQRWPGSSAFLRRALQFLDRIGLGSLAYHGTLLFHMQMLDELPMVYSLTCWLYIWFEVDRPTPRPWLAPALIVFMGVVTAGHLYYGFVVLFQMFFAGQTFLGVYHVWLAVTAPSADRTVKIIAFLYSFSIGSGVGIWLLEQNICTELRVSGPSRLLSVAQLRPGSSFKLSARLWFLDRV